MQAKATRTRYQDKEITQSESALKRLAAANEKTGSTLRALGVDTNVVEKEIGELK